jgi:uncharacterized protein GlcG (DUF336 family)
VRVSSPIRHWPLVAALLAAACGGGGGGGASACSADCTPAPNALTTADVQRVIAQAVGEAQARGLRAHIAVVDRVGNVLATFEMTGAPATIAISSGLGVTGGLDGIPQGTLPAAFASISKAITGAFLSSQGNAFSTRTANQIIQEHFLPQEAGQPSGPLYGVQFSQLSCSDINRHATHGTVGPKRSPLGLAADPGGLPLYKNGILVGGVGVEANGVYGIDRDITDIDQDDEELIAVAGATGFAPPADIRGERITADGRTFRFVDSETLKSNPAQPPSFATLPGAVNAVAGYSSAAIVPGTAFGTAASGIRPADGGLAASGASVLVDSANANRFPAQGNPLSAMSAEDVEALVVEALSIARRARAQIRRPLGSSAEVSVAVVDLYGNVLALARTPDAPVFGTDVAVQKARTAAYFSYPEFLGSPVLPPTGYIADLRASLGADAGKLGGIAFTTRAIGNLHRPFLPDGIEGSPKGPFSTPIERWSPFNVGFQLDAILNQVLRGVAGDPASGCAFRLAPSFPNNAPASTNIFNGMQIFPGGVPIYSTLARRVTAAIGVSGDGVDQDDMIAYLAIENAAKTRGAIRNVPREQRADTLVASGVRLRYVQCPQSPFNGSAEQNVCE